jgi:hypothetical protein
MAQHDYNIANASFPTVRTDINNVLSAVNSSNSGSSRPSSAVAGTIWLDTSGAATAQLLKLYDGADDITLATINFTANTVDFQDSDAGGVTFKQEGTNFTDSLLVGHATTGTLNAAQDNTGVGIGALNALTSGDGNTAVGSEAGGQINSGIRNSVIGNGSGDAITTGDQNTAVGFNSLTTNISSDKNTFLGAFAGENTTGGFNIGIGKSAGGNITSGSGNVVIGSDTSVGSATGSRQLVIAGNDGSTATTWISGSSSGVLTFNAANVTQQALTSTSNAVAWDSSAKPNAVHITTENTTFSAPTNNVEGAFIALEINYNGSHTIAFNTAFEFAASTAPTFTSSDGKTDILVFRYNGAVWQEVGRTLNLSES